MRWVRLTLNRAVRDRRIIASPAEGVRLPRGRRSEMRLLDGVQVAELAAALPDRYESLAIVAAYTGGVSWPVCGSVASKCCDDG